MDIASFIIRYTPSLINTMSSSFKFGCASCHCLRGCREEINSELHFFQKPRLVFCSNSQRSLWLEVEGSSSGTERRTSPVRKCEGVSVDMHSMSESLT
ncbi:hypothetical protein TNCV_1636161 [Trichonephila clavipes]|uniref:Uncharacterized protein n=1 Tax=Trichonephila clavipes TaxID=2585209 RepID=A0A8X6V6B5_TRICX|nr:hypothetical protein TNCV_1636161 [Trichonephila clavipes]